MTPMKVDQDNGTTFGERGPPRQIADDEEQDE
jgi:hypothetical protein